MAVYRYQVICVGFWRGKIKRWNTTFHVATNGYTPLLYNAMQKTGYPNPGDTLGACSGGVSEIRTYNASGGAPISVTTYFDWQAPQTWIPYTGTVWAGVPEDTPIDASGESALLLVGNLPGLSSTGKPMTTRKYIHAIPSRSSVALSDPDVSAASTAAIKMAWSNAMMLSPSGVAPTSIDVEPYYMNHQRVRGKRRSTKAVAANAFSFGVLAGGGAMASGQGEPFPGGEY